MLNSFADFVVKQRWWIILAWVVIAGIIIGFSPQLSSVESNDQSSFLSNTYESIRAANIAKKINPKDTGATDIIVFHTKSGQSLSSSDLAVIDGVVHNLNVSNLPHVLSVTTSAEQRSPNHKAQLAQVLYRGNPQDSAVINAVPKLRQAINKDLQGTDLVANTTGNESIGYDTQGSFNNALKIVSIGTILLVLILPALVFRSPLVGLLPVLSVGLVYSVASALITDAANVFNFKVSQQLSVLFTVVLFGVGTDYILFLMFRYRERLRSGDHSRKAVAFALSRAGVAIASAALVVISSFVALFFAKFGIFKTFAPGLVICVAVMLVAAFTLVPAIVAVLGQKIFWPSKSWKSKSLKPTFSKNLGGFIAKRPGWAGGAVFVLLLALAAAALGYTADFSSFSQPPAKTQSAAAYNTIQADYPAGVSSPTDVYVASQQPLTATSLKPMVSRLKNAQGVAVVAPPLITPNGKYATIAVVLKDDPYSKQAFSAVAGPVHEAAHGTKLPGAQVEVGGLTATFADVQSATDRDLKVIFPIAALFIFIILAVLLRSVIAPIFLLISVSLGFAATLGATVLIFTKIGSEPGLIFFIPILLYVFVVAIGTDYNILTITRLREEVRQGLKPRKAADMTVEHSSATVASAGLILAGTFASLLLARINLLNQMGTAIALGVVLSAFIIAPILVPSVAALLGYVVWWPGHKPKPKR